MLDVNTCIYSKNHPTCTACHTFFALPFKRLRDSGDGFSRFGNRPRKAVAKVVFCRWKVLPRTLRPPKEKRSILGWRQMDNFSNPRICFIIIQRMGSMLDPSTWMLQRYPGFKIAQRASWKPAETTSSSSSCLTVSKKNTQQGLTPHKLIASEGPSF